MSLSYTNYLSPLLDENIKFYMPNSASLMASSPTTNGFVSNNGVTAARTSKTNLYIKGLTVDFTDERLRSLVPQPTLVKSVKAATDDGYTCKGYGFIDFVSEEAALMAQKHIHENYSAFTVKFAKENEKDSTNLYVTNLPPNWKGKKDEDRLKEVFESFGAIQSVHIQTDPSSTRSTGVGFVRFIDEADAKKALDGLKTEPRYLDGSTQPLQAKYADKHNAAARARRNVQASPGGGKIRAYVVPTLNATSPISPYHGTFLRTSPAYPYAPALYAVPTNGGALPLNNALTLPQTMDISSTSTSLRCANTMVATGIPINPLAAAAAATFNPYLSAALVSGGALSTQMQVPSTDSSTVAQVATAMSMSNVHQATLQHSAPLNASPLAALQHPLLSGLPTNNSISTNSSVGCQYTYFPMNAVLPRYIAMDYPQMSGMYSTNVNDQSHTQ